MTDEDALKIIIRALKERDIPYDSDVLQSTFANPEYQAAVCKWVEEYLTPETLLTKNEAALYERLIKTGEVESLARQDLTRVPELRDHEVLSAIDGLRRSTVVTKKQNEAIRLQQNALSALVRSEKRSKQARAQAEKGQVRKWDAEKSSIAAQISELTQSLIYQTSDIELHLKTSDNSLRQTVDSILQSDDKLLLSFQKLASEVGTKPENEDVLASIKELCARYIKYTVEGMRVKLDRIFLDTLANSSSSQNYPATQEKVDQLQEDLESLYTEILPLAQMSAEQQYLDPALRAIGTTNNHDQHRSLKAMEYIDSCLSYLTDRIRAILQRGQEYQSYQITVEAIVEKAKAELSSHEVRLTTTMSPPPPQLRAATSSPRQFDQIEPEYQLSRTLGVKIPELDASEEIYVATLDKILSERTARLENNATSLQATVESYILSHLLDSSVTLNRLRDVLLSHSDYHTIKLADPELTKAEDSLEKEISQARNKLEAVNLKEPLEDNPYRNEFVNRWSR